MLTREDYRQLAERCALLAGECGAPGIAEALRALALITWRGLQARSNNRRSDFRNKFVTHMARGKSVAGVGRRGTLSSTRGRGGKAQ
jgi:hypothetical protein